MATIAEHIIGLYEERIMNRSSKERERQSRRAGYQSTKRLKLAMGAPNRCFYNATSAVWTHHAWVLDKLTGTRHELSFREDPRDVYIGKEFTKDEMIDRSDELLDGHESWMNMLTAPRALCERY
jgi:hypothetical protein